MAGVSAGTVVGGKYRLESPIGQGGMGSVWRATHTILESPVAVKFLETYGSARQEMGKRFLREAKLAGGLKHRNVVHILDFGVMDDGQPFMVMELLEGQSLGDRIDDGPDLEPIELLDIMAKVLSGLAAVHEAGIIHRDIKPDNIFLVRDAEGLYPKLLDFGISRGAESDGSDTRVTRTGAVMGTPLYMSPEQARGMKDIDARTDLWSVGMILFEGLSGGELPFEAEHMGDILIRVATEDAPSLATRRPDLPKEVVSIVDRALSRPREKRFESARQMRDAVVKAIEVLRSGGGTPIGLPRTAELSTPSAEASVVREPKSPRGPLMVAGGVVLTLAVAIGVVVALGVEVRIGSGEPAPTSDAPSIASPPSATGPAPSPTPTSGAPEAAPEAAPTAASVPQAPSAPARSEPARTSPGVPTPVAEPAVEPVPVAEPTPEPTPEPQPVAATPEPAAPAPESPRPRRTPSSADSERGRTGTFLRDLDY
jgi:serine/threonine-protein kinase